MLRRLSIVPLTALLVGLVGLPACKKQQPGTDGGDPAATGGVPVVSSEHVLFVSLNAKSVRDSAIFTELKQAVAKADATALWDKFEGEFAGTFGGLKPTDIDSVTACVADVPAKGPPTVFVAVTATKAIDKSIVKQFGGGPEPDSRGLYKGRDFLLHFPDAKTVVLLHPDVAQKYLDGYAKERTGWPLTPELAKASAGHTLFATLRPTKIPKELLRGNDVDRAESLLAAQTITLVADLKGKELTVAAQGVFPDAAAAEKGKETVKWALGEATAALGEATGSEAELGGAAPLVKEAQRALKEAKVEVSGATLTVSGSYAANFDFAAAMTDAAKKIRAAAARMTASNNVKMIALSMHNYHDTFMKFPLRAMTYGPKGVAPGGLSWRVHILPYMEQQALYKQFKLDEPWDSENNKKLIEKMPKVYASPTAPAAPGMTYYKVFHGPGAVFGADSNLTNLFAISDGTSNTIMVVEGGPAVIWTKPDDIEFDPKKPLPDLRLNGNSKILIGLFDGSVRTLDLTKVKPDTVKAAITAAGGETLGPDWNP